jgi:hypothetical protein
MKSILLFTFLAIITFGCKKNYDCACQTDITFPSGNHKYYSSNTKPVNKKLNKKQAQALCDQEAKSINSTHEAFITNNGNFSSNGYSAKTSCKLE